jgi:hypothetical protein
MTHRAPSVLSAMLLIHGFAPVSVFAADQPNILFIYLDDFGWRDTGFMGSDSCDRRQVGSPTCKNQPTRRSWSGQEAEPRTRQPDTQSQHNDKKQTTKSQEPDTQRSPKAKNQPRTRHSSQEPDTQRFPSQGQEPGQEPDTQGSSAEAKNQRPPKTRHSGFEHRVRATEDGRAGARR